ncbi:phosphatase PAP2 family protein [Nakamurella sp. YIM 132087]|uniref:Phosphatase PAP2 family protein n=1 Tax=Nakamurella alba TaxID=2665158 RepID=A0A7K1FJX6_9ACTN|nr:phosphatase PAP2 family protein [Nakamurella alba]MTD14386.1 phosphatase PAP2 family protein [Nakamurella alba]
MAEVVDLHRGRSRRSDDRRDPLIERYGYVWLPYAIAAVALIAIALIARHRRQLGPAMRDRLVLRAAALLVLAGAILLLADAATEGDGLASFDIPVWQRAIDLRADWLTPVVIAWTTIGSTVGMTVICLIGFGYLMWRKDFAGAGLLATVGIGAGLLVVIGKRIVGRTRPPVDMRLVTETNESFPSGHALAATAVLGIVVLLVRRHLRDRRWIMVAVVLGVFWLGIGLSRIYLGVHWATDILGGWLTGAAWLITAVTIWDFLDAARRPPWRRVAAVAGAAAEGVAAEGVVGVPVAGMPVVGDATGAGAAGAVSDQPVSDPPVSDPPAGTGTPGGRPARTDDPAGPPLSPPGVRGTDPR